MLAAQQGKTDLLKLLLAKGTDLKVRIATAIPRLR
jgi:hypothetical protein